MSKQNTSKKSQQPYHRPANPVMAEKLQGFRGRATNNRPTETRLTDLEGDSIDHINIYQNPKTKLGVILSPFTERPFTIPLHGRFNSRQGLYYYLLSSNGDESYRIMKPKFMRRQAQINGNIRPYCPNLRYFMAQALCAQIKDDETALDLFFENKLPFEAYFTKQFRVDDVVSRVPSRPNSARWMVEIANAVSKAIKEGKELDLSMFVDKPEDLEALQKKLTRPYTPPPAPKKKQPKTEAVEEAQKPEGGLPEYVPPVVEKKIVNVVHSGLAFKTAPGGNWIAGMPETTPIEALSAAVARDGSESAHQGSKAEFVAATDERIKGSYFAADVQGQVGEDDCSGSSPPLSMDEVLEVLDPENTVTAELPGVPEIQQPVLASSEAAEQELDHAFAAGSLNPSSSETLAESQTLNPTQSAPESEQPKVVQDKVVTNIPRSATIPTFKESL